MARQQDVTQRIYGGGLSEKRVHLCWPAMTKSKPTILLATLQ